MGSEQTEPQEQGTGNPLEKTGEWVHKTEPLGWRRRLFTTEVEPLKGLGPTGSCMNIASMTKIVKTALAFRYSFFFSPFNSLFPTHNHYHIHIFLFFSFDFCFFAIIFSSLEFLWLGFKRTWAAIRRELRGELWQSFFFLFFWESSICIFCIVGGYKKAP